MGLVSRISQQVVPRRQAPLMLSEGRGLESGAVMHTSRTVHTEKEEASLSVHHRLHVECVILLASIELSRLGVLCRCRTMHLDEDAVNCSTDPTEDGFPLASEEAASYLFQVGTTEGECNGHLGDNGMQLSLIHI